MLCIYMTNIDMYTLFTSYMINIIDFITLLLLK